MSMNFFVFFLFQKSYFVQEHVRTEIFPRLNFYPSENVKFVINYQFNDQDVFANGKGEQDGTDKTAKNPYCTGYDEAGNVTKFPGLVAKNSKSKGIDYHMIACRFQVAF